MCGAGISIISITEGGRDRNEFVGKDLPTQCRCVYVSKHNGVGGYMRGVHSSTSQKSPPKDVF